MEPEYLRLARLIKGEEYLDQDLTDILAKVNRLIKNAKPHGALRSSQMVALIIMMFDLGWFGRGK